MISADKIALQQSNTLDNPTANELLTQIEEDEEVVLVFDEYAEEDDGVDSPGDYPRAEFEEEDDDEDSWLGDSVLDLERVSGIEELEEISLNSAGYETIGDLRRADQSDLTDASRIGNATAARIKADVGDADVEEDDDLFNPDERFPPQFHLDNLESQLDFNLGQVDGFFDLDWGAKCDLAKLAVDNDLDLESTETIVEMSLAGAGDDDE